MIQFRQKEFSEYDAMRQLYVELDKQGLIRNRVISIIDQSALIPVLRGNNVVIEKFTQAPRVFGKDRYRLYLKIGARAKMPDDVRMPQYSQKRSLGNLNLGLNYGFKVGGDGGGNNNQNKNPNGGDNSSSPTLGLPYYSTNTSSSGNNKPSNTGKKKSSKNGKKKAKFSVKGKNYSDTLIQKEFADDRFIKAEFRPNIDFLNYYVHKLLADSIKYDKRDRSLVLEVDTIQDAIRALNILPFGLGYKIYLLNS